MRGFEHLTAGDVAKLGKQAAQGAGKLHKARSKYGAVPTTVDGITFHSAAEARRYGELKLLERAEKIRNLKVQPRFPLWVSRNDMMTNDPQVLLGEYVGDFSYWTIPELGGVAEFVVEDVKGMTTLPLAKWKQKHLTAQYGITVVEIR